MNKELYHYMEQRYKEHGASCNGAQLNIRGSKLDKMITLYGEDKVRCMLTNAFDAYHFNDCECHDCIDKENCKFKEN